MGQEGRDVEEVDGGRRGRVRQPDSTVEGWEGQGLGGMLGGCRDGRDILGGLERRGEMLGGSGVCNIGQASGEFGRVAFGRVA
eukprot:3642211-Rhodomonas_salina.1